MNIGFSLHTGKQYFEYLQCTEIIRKLKNIDPNDSYTYFPFSVFKNFYKLNLLTKQ